MNSVVVRCVMWDVGCGVWGELYGVRCMRCEVWWCGGIGSGVWVVVVWRCGMWGVDCGVWSVGVWDVVCRGVRV